MRNLENQYLNKKEKLETALLQMPENIHSIFSSFVLTKLSKYNINTYLNVVDSYIEMMKNINPEILDENYILQNIQKYKYPAWSFYQFLYEKAILGNEYRFLKNTTNYDIISHIIDNNLSVKNILCCKVGKNDNRYIVTTQNRTAINMVEEYFSTKHSTAFSPDLPEYLTSFLDKHNITSGKDITDKIIEDCIFCAPSKLCAQICKYFLIYHLLKSNDEHLKRYSISILSKTNFVTNFLGGFRTVLYNKFESAPQHDKWMLIPNGDEKHTTIITAEATLIVDFSSILNPQMKQIIKEWFWTSNSTLVTKTKDLYVVIAFANIYFQTDVAITNINQTICAHYKSFVLSKWKITGTRNNKIYPVLSLIQYIDNYTSINVDKGCYLHLNNNGPLKRNGAISVDKNALNLIASYIDEHKSDDHNHLCYYVIFHIALNTEFRISEILTLSTDCVKDSMKAGEYIIRSNTKQSGYEKDDQPCARIVKEIISTYLHATNEYREQLQTSFRKYLFIKEDGKTKLNRPFTSSDFSKFLNQVCRDLNLPNYTAKNLRITHITNAKEYCENNNLSELTLLSATNHSLIDTVKNHYIHERIKDALQATIGVIIGDVKIDGTISDNCTGYDTSKESSVANGCGFCQSTSCTSQGPSPCQRCKYFFTTISNIPYYKKEIERLKTLNNGEKNPHDAEDYIKLIRLNTYILEKLIKLKGNY